MYLVPKSSWLETRNGSGRRGEVYSSNRLLGLAAARRGLAKKDDTAAYSEVESLLKRALDKQPNHLSATFNLGVLYADYLKRPSEARPLFERFLSQAPKTHPGRAEAERFLSAQKR